MLPGLMAAPRILPSAPYVPGSPVLVFDSGFSAVGFSYNIKGYNGCSIRQPIRLSGATGRQLRLTVRNSYHMDHISVGVRPSSGNTYNVYRPAEIKFGGVSGVSGSGGFNQQLVSDWVEMPSIIIPGTDVVFILDCAATQPSGAGMYTNANRVPHIDSFIPVYKPATASYDLATPDGVWQLADIFPTESENIFIDLVEVR